MSGARSQDLERLEIILKLGRELGMNLAAVEIILNMREKREAMQRQMEGFVRTLNQELSERAANRAAENSQSLVPVIQINSVGVRSDAKRGPDGPKRRR